MNFNKLIFLDFDGVLNNHQFLLNLTREDRVADKRFEPTTIANLNHITEKTDASIVVTSEVRWEFHNRFTDLRKLMRDNGIVGKVVGKLDTGNSALPKHHGDIVIAKERGDLIFKWLDDHALMELNTIALHNRMVILDDTVDDRMKVLFPNCIVQCQPDTGLTQENVIRAIEILSR